MIEIPKMVVVLLQVVKKKSYPNKRVCFELNARRVIGIHYLLCILTIDGLHLVDQ